MPALEADPHVAAALFYGALRIAAGIERAPWPAELADLAERYFAVFRPRAQG